MMWTIKALYKHLKLDEKANFITHGIGLIVAIIASPFLLLSEPYSIQFWGLVAYVFGMIFMFFSSTFYHLANHDVRKNKWRMIDHISIFLLIGGTYTPFILFYYNTPDGLHFLLLHWMIIIFGIIFKLIFKTRFEIVSLIIYVVLGWMVIFIFNEISLNMSPTVLTWLLVGGFSYTIGVYFYIKTHLPWHHAIWHIFVIIGCLAHFIALILS